MDFKSRPYSEWLDRQEVRKMDDVIYRQDVLNLIPQNISDFEEGSCLAYDVGKLPSAQQWIPCSERLPEEKGRYLITSIWGPEAFIYVFDGTDDAKEHWRKRIKAWMPLPEPYKEDE